MKMMINRHATINNAALEKCFLCMNKISEMNEIHTIILYMQTYSERTVVNIATRIRIAALVIEGLRFVQVATTI